MRGFFHHVLRIMYQTIRIPKRKQNEQESEFLFMGEGVCQFALRQ